VVINHFREDQVGGCALTWSARSQKVALMDVWSKPRTLAPGEQMRLETDYELPKSK
jgi:hypothetical protein